MNLRRTKSEASGQGSGSHASDEGGTVKGFAATLWKFIELNIENARLTASEKATLLFTAVAFYAMLFIVGSISMFFVSIGIGHLLASTIAPHWAYLFVAAFYVLVLVLMIVFKNRLFLNPISRFVTRLFLAPPAQDGQDDEVDDEELDGDLDEADYDGAGKGSRN